MKDAQARTQQLLLLLLVLLLISCSQSSSHYPPDYFDRLRQGAPVLDSILATSDNSSVYSVRDADGNDFRLVDISAFLPFTSNNGETFRGPSVRDDAAAALLAVHHFNHQPTLTQQCPDLRLTLELMDTQFSPIQSTRILTNVLRRQGNLTHPIPTAVVGAYRSATTSPLAILTGVNGIPQVSYASTSSDFDVKEQYPLFGRTVTNSMGEAQVALDLFLSLQATHVGVLFVTDSYGSALQKAFQDAASEKNVTTHSVAFSFSADATEIPDAVRSLKSTQYRIFFVICFEDHYDAILQAAYQQGIVGPGFLWIFPSFDLQSFHQKVFPVDSPLAIATRGIGIFSIQGGITTKPYVPGQDRVADLQENPTSGFEQFRTAWRQALADSELVQYLKQKLPLQQEDDFGSEPGPWSPLIYDAVMGLALSMCRAVDFFFTGPQINSQFRHLDFEGASGRVQIDNETGTRYFDTLSYSLWNAQPYDVDEAGNARFQYVPTDQYVNGQWTPDQLAQFVYADGTTLAPDSLPVIDMEYNYIGSTGRIVGYILMGIVSVTSIGCFVWTIRNWNERVIRASQPMFLFMISLGSLLMASTTIPLSLEETVVDDQRGLDKACMAAPWLYVLGAVIAFSALFAKTRGLRQAFINPDLEFIHVSALDILVAFVILLALNLIVMISWTSLSPLEWERNLGDATDIFERPTESYGTCTHPDALPFVVVTLVLNLGLLIVANVWAYQARNIETEYNESRYIGISMASVLQAWCMGIPILIVVWDNPQAKFYVQIGIVFVTTLAILLLIFVPKFLAIDSDRLAEAAEQKRQAYSNFIARQETMKRVKEGIESPPPKDEEVPPTVEVAAVPDAVSEEVNTEAAAASDGRSMSRLQRSVRNLIGSFSSRSLDTGERMGDIKVLRKPTREMGPIISEASQVESDSRIQTPSNTAERGHASLAESSQQEHSSAHNVIPDTLPEEPSEQEERGSAAGES